MRIAVFSDIHGNLEALSAVLRDIDVFEPDFVICAGDIVNPLPTSAEVYSLIKRNNIPCIRGNHEDYVIDYRTKSGSLVHSAVQFQPVRLVGDTFSKSEIAEMASLPLNISVSHPSGKNVLICHASPNSNRIGYLNGVSADLESELAARPEEIIVCGHWHEPTTTSWRNKTLVIAGSVGIPMKGRPLAEYVRLTFDNSKWNVAHVEVPYAHNKTVDNYVDSGFVKKGGPVAWLLLDEIISSRRRLAYFFPWLKTRPEIGNFESDWEAVVTEFLINEGRWAYVSPFIR